LPIKLIARTLGISKNTVRAAIGSDAPPKYERKPAGSAVDAFERAIREQLMVVPTMPATTSRTAYVAGEIAQCELWFPPIELPVGFRQVRRPAQLPVLTMVTGYSRWLSAILLPTRRADDLFAGWWRLIHALGAVPRTLVWDGEGAIGRNRGGRIELTQECQAFRGVLGTKVIVLKPAEPEHKGIIERAHDYLERSFLPGRDFAGPDDFNVQLQGWLAQVNTRKRRALGCAPMDRIGADLAAMLGFAAGCPGHRVADLDTAGAGPLRAPGLQRLLGAPRGDRPPHRGPRRPRCCAAPASAPCVRCVIPKPSSPSSNGL